MFPDLPAGPPLGLGAMPFETADLEVAEESCQAVLDALLPDRPKHGLSSELRVPIP
ncbi:hypothetical protein ACVWZD_005996 [Streptomyces sp. TE3672]